MESTSSGADRRIGRSRIADQIVDDLRERILSAELPNGSRLPAERELAEQYGVSGATIREAVRVLATIGLVDVRHGAGSFVTAESDTMIGMSIASVVRLEGVGARELLGLLGALNRYAAQLAVQESTDAEIASLREAAEKLAVIDDIDRTIEDLRAFMRRLSEISHNALLIPLCRLLADVQVELAAELSGGRVSEWRRVSGGLHADRLAIVEAVESRSPERAAEAVDAHSAHAARLILSTPQAKRIQIADPGYARLLAGLLNARLSSAAT
ncbi:FadR/GntR family transcriptional regulator [Sphaerisporangium perillae]|uniref:FadR/GntR family transcriptional regulator n=1 Tax=Sphaerisporangium perillae TaxID=2935860 RepID=UPI00200E5C24|nr:GntR family transcriptional regulator [Sphaerisporangium perillae]